jgi:hypothetical protein
LRLISFENRKVFPDIFNELISVIQERLNMKESSEFCKAYGTGPFELPINSVKVEAVPHLDLVHSIGRDIVDTS